MTIVPTMFTVLGYNTHLFVDTIVDNSFVEQTYYDYERIDGIIGKIKEIKPDIVGLCEVWAKESKDKFIEKLKDILPYWCDDNSRHIGYALASGLLILSRYPITWNQFYPFTRSDLTGADWNAQKGFLAAIVDLAYNQQLMIILTHTNSGGFFAPVSRPPMPPSGFPDPAYIELLEEWEKANGRRNNLIQIQNWINSRPNPMPYILFGDLNLVAGTPQYYDINNIWSHNSLEDSYIDQSPLDDGFTADEINNKLNQIFSPGGEKHRMRVDYMLTGGRNDASPVSTLGFHGVNVLNDFKFKSPDGVMDLSDHYPLFGAFYVRYDLEYGLEDGWRFCHNCYSLFWRHADNHCPANDGGRGPHYYPEGGSFNYALVHDVAPGDHNENIYHYQSGWWWCSNCGGLFYEPEAKNCICPATNSNHNFWGNNNALLYNCISPTSHSQADWRYCTKCKGLFFGGATGKGVCPVTDANGNQHEYIETWFNYILPYVTSYLKL
jgi:endonuclease/exonuclease/phosphatase family metal-dependent hydrolase